MEGVVCVYVRHSVTALENHTPCSTHQGTSVSLWFCPVTPPSSLLSSAAHSWNRSTTYNGGAMRSKYAPHPTLSPQRSLPPTFYLHRPAAESQPRPPVDTRRLAAERQAHPATTSRPPSHNSHLQRHAWAERLPASHTERAHKQDKSALSASNAYPCKIKREGRKLETFNNGYCVYCVELFAIMERFINVTLFGRMRCSGREVEVSAGTFSGNTTLIWNLKSRKQDFKLLETRSV